MRQERGIVMKKNKILLAVCVLLSLMMVFSACGKNNKKVSSVETEKPGTATEEPAKINNSTSGDNNTSEGNNTAEDQNTNPSETPASPAEESPGEAPEPVTEPGVSEVIGTPEESADVEPIVIPSMENGASFDSIKTVLQKYGLNDGELNTAPDGTSYQESTSEKYSCTIYLDEQQKVYDLILSGDTSDESKAFFTEVASVFYDGASSWIQNNLGKEASTTENGYVISLSQTNNSVLRITGESYHGSINAPQ